MIVKFLVGQDIAAASLDDIRIRFDDTGFDTRVASIHGEPKILEVDCSVDDLAEVADIMDEVYHGIDG